jgi:hypothetical protein
MNVTTVICRTWEESRLARVRLWDEVAQANRTSLIPLKWVTYNGLHFDCPTMETHQRLDGLRLFGMDIRKYGSKNIIDLYDLLTFSDNCGEQVLYRKLPVMAFHFDIPIPEEDIDGSQVAALIASGDAGYERVAQHCAFDVEMTAALYKRLGIPWRAIVFDIETVPKNGIDLATVKPDGRLTDPAKIEASQTQRLEKAGLDPFANRIVVLGYTFIDEIPAHEARTISAEEAF